MAEHGALQGLMTRRRLLATARAAGVALSRPAWAQAIDLPAPGGFRYAVCDRLDDGFRVILSLPRRGLWRRLVLGGRGHA